MARNGSVPMIRLMGRIIIHAFFCVAFTILRWCGAAVQGVTGRLIRFAERFD